MIRVKIKSLAVDRKAKSHVVLLEDLEGSRVLPIWIGSGEAQALALALGRIDIRRPLAHDLILDVLYAVDGDVERTLITRVEKQTYFAEIVAEVQGKIVVIDARPSDAIVLAMKCGASIFARESLLYPASPEVSPEAKAETLFQNFVLGRGQIEGQELEDHLWSMNPEDLGQFEE